MKIYREMHELEKGRTENQDPIWDKRDRPVNRRIEREEQKGKNRNPKPIYPKNKYRGGTSDATFRQHSFYIFINIS